MEQIKNEELKTMLSELAEKFRCVYRDKLKTVILYGSVARGSATDESDIDIAVLIDGTNEELKAYEDKLSDVSTDFLSRIPMKPFALAEGDTGGNSRELQMPWGGPFLPEMLLDAAERVEELVKDRRFDRRLNSYRCGMTHRRILFRI